MKDKQQGKKETMILFAILLPKTHYINWATVEK